MEIKVNNFETIEKLKKNTHFRITTKNSIENGSFPIEKLYFSKEIFICYTKHCICLEFLQISNSSI